MQEEELADGMEGAFKALAESYVPDGVGIDLSFTGDESTIPNPVRLQMYLAMREAVRNAVRHFRLLAHRGNAYRARREVLRVCGGRREGLRSRGGGQGHSLVGRGP